MNKQQAEERVKELQAALEQSIANHNGLVGRMQEAQHFLSMCEDCSLEEAELVEQVVGQE